jgi:hypothetical protein
MLLNTEEEFTDLVDFPGVKASGSAFDHGLLLWVKLVDLLEFGSFRRSDHHLILAHGFDDCGLGTRGKERFGATNPKLGVSPEAPTCAGDLSDHTAIFVEPIERIAPVYAGVWREIVWRKEPVNQEDQK